jgi:putative ABC transport system ATP-binding protein
VSAAPSLVAEQPLIALEGLTRSFAVGDQTVEVLRGITVAIARGEYVAIIGPSGSGKSTLLYQLGCLDTPTAGTYRLAGWDVSQLDDTELAVLRNRTIGFVFQAFHLLPHTTAVDNVALPLRYAGVSLRERRARSRAALERVRLGHRLDAHPERLSGGERQRVAIARAIVHRPELILGDEPTGNLDQKVGREIVDLFEDLNRELGATVILVTHDLEIARRTRRVIRIVDGLVQYDGPPAGLP